MVRKRTKARQEEFGEDIFAALERHGTHNFREEPARREASPAGEPTVAQLQAQISALSGQLDDMTRRSMMRPAAPPAPQQQQQPALGPQDVKLDLVTGLPDPIDKPIEYQRALQDRIAAYVAAQTEVVKQTATAAATRGQQEAASQQQADRLWNDFSTQYPDWAEYGDIVQVVAKQVVEREQAKGIDGQTYILGNTPTFFRDVEAELKKRYGRLIEDAEAEGEEEPEGHEHHAIAPRRGAPVDNDLDDGRTAGVFGGQESGGKPSRGRQAPAAGADMISDLQAMQMKTGYY